MNLNFTEEEKLDVLEFLGYKTETIEKTFYQNVYHNQVEEYDRKVIQVYDQYGELIPFNFNDLGINTKLQQVNEIFEKEFKQFMLKQWRSLIK